MLVSSVKRGILSLSCLIKDFSCSWVPCLCLLFPSWCTRWCRWWDFPLRNIILKLFHNFVNLCSFSTLGNTKCLRFLYLKKKNGLWNLQIIIFINISHSVTTFLELAMNSLNIKEKALWARTAAVKWCCCELVLFAMKMNVSWKDNKRNSVAVSLCSFCFLQVWMDCGCS